MQTLVYCISFFRSPLVEKSSSQGSPKRKAEPLPFDPLSTPPSSKRHASEKNMSPYSTRNFPPPQSPLASKSPRGKGMNESPARAILGELSPSVCRGSPKHLAFNQDLFDDEDKVCGIILLFSKPCLFLVILCKIGFFFV